MAIFNLDAIIILEWVGIFETDVTEKKICMNYAEVILNKEIMIWSDVDFSKRMETERNVCM